MEINEPNQRQSTSYAKAIENFKEAALDPTATPTQQRHFTYMIATSYCSFLATSRCNVQSVEYPGKTGLDEETRARLLASAATAKDALKQIAMRGESLLPTPLAAQLNDLLKMPEEEIDADSVEPLRLNK